MSDDEDVPFLIKKCIRYALDNYQLFVYNFLKYLTGSAHGEIYGLDHDMTRMSPWNMALTRPETVN